jgi:transposase
MNRVMLLLFKYVFKPELQHKLPEIFSLLRTLMEKETGLQYLETVIRYLASVLDEEELSLKQIKEVAELAISKETGGYIMTLAEKLRKEGEKRGEKKGEKKGYRQAIEVGMAIRFPGDIDTVMAEVNKIDDLEILIEITKRIHTAEDISEILALIK